MASRSRKWLLLLAACGFLSVGSLFLFKHMQSQLAQGTVVEERDSRHDPGALLRKRWRVQGTVALMARAKNACRKMTADEFLQAWRDLPAERRARGRIDALARQICGDPAKP